MCSIQFVPESDVCPQLVTGHKVCTPNSPINSCNKREKVNLALKFQEESDLPERSDEGCSGRTERLCPCRRSHI